MDLRHSYMDIINATNSEEVPARYQLEDGDIIAMSHVTPSLLLNETSETSTTNVAASGPLPLGQSIVIGVVLGLLILITLLGNGLVITAVATFRRLRSITNYFVVSLAVADITVATLVMPYMLLYEIFLEWRFGWVFCYFWISCDVTCCTASILHLCVIAFDRYLAITQPFSYHSKMSKKKALLMIGGVWVFSISLSFVPIYLGWFADTSKMEDLYVDSPMCGLFVNKVYAVISSSLSFYGPLLVMIFAYVKIFRIASRQAREIRRLENSIAPDHLLINNGSHRDPNVGRVRKRSKRVQKDSKAIKTLGTLVGLFCISWLPFFLMYLIVPFCESCDVPPLLVSVITWLGYTNSCINPCVYAFLNRDFRVAFKRILSCGGRCNKGDNRNSRYKSGCCDMHGSYCSCDRHIRDRRHSSSSSDGRTPSLLSRDRLKLEMKPNQNKQNGFNNKVSQSDEKKMETDPESPITESVDFKVQTKTMNST